MTYKTFASAQEILDHVAPLLFAQGQRSMLHPCAPDDEEPQCAYRGEGGLRCAVGFIIPDELYNPNIEGSSAISEDLKGILGKIITTPFGNTYSGLGRFLADFQDVHDGWICDGIDGKDARTNLIEDLLSLASRYDLDETVLHSLADQHRKGA